LRICHIRMWEDSLCAVYKGTEHSLRLLQVKMKDDNKKDYCTFANPWQFKTKGAVRAVYILLRNWQLGG
jgi:hypothetical protein